MRENLTTGKKKKHAGGGHSSGSEALWFRAVWLHIREECYEEGGGEEEGGGDVTS